MAGFRNSRALRHLEFSKSNLPSIRELGFRILEMSRRCPFVEAKLAPVSFENTPARERVHVRSDRRIRKLRPLCDLRLREPLAVVCGEEREDGALLVGAARCRG